MGSNNPALSAQVSDNNDGTYNASFTPRTVGKHQLSITIDGAHIKDSPIPVYVRERQGNYGRSLDSVKVFSLSGFPYDVAVDDNGTVYVALYNYNCIEVYSKDGRRICTIGTHPKLEVSTSSRSGNAQLYDPSAIAVSEGMLYIAEYTNNCVQMVTTSGKFVSTFGEGHLSSPRGICIDYSSGRVFVSSLGNNCVAVFEANGTFISCFGHRDLRGPWGLSFDNIGNLHVASTIESSIVVFTRDGKHIATYNSGVNKPAGVAIDDEGNTFVVDNEAGYSYEEDTILSELQEIRQPTVAMLNSQHQVIASWDAGGNATGVTIDKEGSIYVCNYGGHCIFKY